MSLAQNPQASRRPAHIPTLRSGVLDPNAFAHSTCFEAGYLVAKNAGWRNKRPVIDPVACTGCLQCYMHCPDGTVYKVPLACQPTEQADAAASRGTQSAAAGEGSRNEVRHASTIDPSLGTTETLADVGGPGRSQVPVAIDYDFCKGCGICAKVCAFGTIAMVPECDESEASA